MLLEVPENVTDATGTYVSPERAAQDTEVARYWERVLQTIDPRLRLIFVPPLDPTKPNPWPQDCRWYIVRRNDLVADSFWVIQDEEGGYSAPTEHHVERFKEKDTWTNPRLWKKIEREYHARVAEAKRKEDAKREEFREKLLERLDFNYETQIAVTPGMKERLAGGKEDGDAGLEPGPTSG